MEDVVVTEAIVRAGIVDVMLGMGRRVVRLESLLLSSVAALDVGVGVVVMLLRLRWL